jgi:hypothetical protein
MIITIECVYGKCDIPFNVRSQLLVNDIEEIIEND